MTRRFGPGLLVTAAFIGPGTVATATQAGAGFGFALLWVIGFAIVATIVLQEMSARLGLVTRAGLGEALRTTFDHRVVRAAVVVLVVSAITLGNAAFQTGNITGAAMGLQVLTGLSHATWALIVGAVAFVMLLTGTYKIIERALVALIVVMSVVFVVTAAMVAPPIGDMLKSLFNPTLPQGSLTTAIALVGTTVVPYNLFLHASAVYQKWPSSVPTGRAIREARLDTVIAVVLGGVITLSIVITAAAFFRNDTGIDSAAAMAAQLEPLLGRGAKYFFATGLLAAGLTSAVTAPLAAAYATVGVMGFPVDARTWRFRAVWMVVLAVGTLAAVGAGRSPVSAIIFAQAANGIILPIIAVFLLVVVNRSRIMQNYTNGALANVLGVGVVLFTTSLSVYKLASVLR